MPERCADNAVDGFLARVTSRLRERTGADLAFAAFVQPRTRELTIRHADGASTDECLGMIIPAGKGIGGRVVALGRHVLADQATTRVSGRAGLLPRDCHEQVRSVLAMPMRLWGRPFCVLYVAGRSDQSISAPVTRNALAYVRQVELFLAQAARNQAIDGPRSWNVDLRALMEIDGELLRLSGEVAAPPARDRIASIRTLLEDSVLQSVAADLTDAAFSLTRREQTVLELVAEGLSNGEAAERLVVSPQTVKAHMRTILGKLGVHNRTAAVAVARRRGLLP
jgi:DNA-binding CsgD family transcriptional regulator